MRRKFATYVITIAVISLSLLIGNCSKQHFELSRFLAPETCGMCHGEIYGQWKNSMHSLSHSDVLYQAVSKYFLKGLTDPDEVKESGSCVKCHIPVGFVSGLPKTVSEDSEKMPEIARKGIQCDYCHSATGAKKMYNNDLSLDPGAGAGDPGIKRGPFKDSNASFHKTQFSEFHTSSRICGTCHNVRHVVFGTRLESTYDEWEKGPYNSADPDKRVECQGCHMYQRPGVPATGSTARPKNPGKAASGGPDRDHIFTHYFAGGNTFVPSMSGNATMSTMALDRLKNAARLGMDASAVKAGKIKVSVANTGAGHYLPTGLTDTRQMWLEIMVKDAGGRVIHSSGRADRDGYLPAGTIIYNTVFGDGKGRPVTNIAKAREILKDRRVPPQKSLEETIDLPAGKYTSLTVEVRLLYRLAPQDLVDAIAGRGKIKLPVVTMAELKRQITL